MGDKAIISEILEASHLTDTYRDLKAKDVIENLVKFKKDDAGSSVRYEGFRDEITGETAPPMGDGNDRKPVGRVHFGSTDDAASQKDRNDDYDEEEDDDDNDADVFGSRRRFIESRPLITSTKRSTLGATFTIDQAVDALGFGKFQIRLSILTGLAWMADAMEMMILSILSPALHCEWWLDSWQLALITTVVFCGMMLSSTMWGNITDKYGRKTELIMCTVVTFYYGLISSLAPNFMWLLILRGLAGFGIGGVPQSVTLYAEYLPSAHRAKCVVLIESFWAIGACFEVLLALFVMPTLGWRWLLALSSLPMLIFTCCCVWLPESARFHVASGHPELAMATLKRVAEENGRPMLEGKLVENGAQDVQRGRFLDLFLPESRRTTLTLWFIWMTNAFSYYGIVLFTTELFQSGDECHGGGDMRVEPQCPLECRQLSTKDYMDLLWTTLAEFPGLIMTAVIIEWLGRKKTMALEFFVYSVFVFMLFICLDRSTTTIFIFVARAFISGAFQVAYVYTPEVYPTTTRAIGLGCCSAMARIGAIVTPFVAQVAAKKSLSIPISIYGAVCLFGAVASLLLPIETKGREMKDFHH